MTNTVLPVRTIPGTMVPATVPETVSLPAAVIVVEATAPGLSTIAVQVPDACIQGVGKTDKIVVPTVTRDPEITIPAVSDEPTPIAEIESVVGVAARITPVAEKETEPAAMIPVKVTPAVGTPIGH